jgi:hypothetical protein
MLPPNLSVNTDAPSAALRAGLQMSEPSRGDFVILLVKLGAACAATWWHWLRPGRSDAA